MFLASVADATKRITLGTGTLNMPNAHPATVAAQVAMLDHMLEGRLIMGISPGGLMSDAEVFGNYEKDRNAIFLEAIDMVLEIWKRDGPYDLHGEHFSVTTAQTMIPEIGQGTILKPYQKPHPPIVVTAVAPHSRGVTEAAKRGWSSDLGELPPARVGRVALAALRRGLRRDRRDGRSGRLARRQVHLRRRRRDHRAALRQVRPKGRTTSTSRSCCASSSRRAGASNLFKLDPSEPDDALTPERVTDRLVIAGTVDSVVEQLLAFRRTTGDFGTLLYACMDWKDEALGRRSMQLLAEQVMPRLNAALAAAHARHEPRQ